jgi:hypothetical protein
MNNLLICSGLNSVTRGFDLARGTLVQEEPHRLSQSIHH